MIRMRHGQENLVRQPSNKHFVFGPGNNIGAERLTAAVVAAFVVAAMLGMTLGETSAKTNIEGKSDAISLTAEDAPIGEVLAAFSAKFGLIYTPAPGLNLTVAGTYSGTLQQVLTRILDGCDYVASYSGDKIELTIFGLSGSAAQPSGLPPQPSLAAANTAVNAPPSGPVLANAYRPGR
jgi:hypothetical protein